MMDEARLNRLLLEKFPELEEDFGTYTSWQDGIDTGCFLTFEDVLLPRAIDAFKSDDEDFINRVCAFAEELLATDDEYARNVADIALLEGLKAFVGGKKVRPMLGPIARKEFDAI